MFKYLVAILLTFVSFTSYSESSKVEITCMKYQNLEQILNEWKEIPLARGISVRSEDRDSKNVIVVFVNSKTKTWTISESTSTGLYCILAAGGGFEPVPFETVEMFKKYQEGL